MNDKVNILGTEYTIRIRRNDDDRKLESCNGYIELYSKEIILKSIEANCYTLKKLDEYNQQTLRHEIIHAFFHESGMTEWCEDEALVGWLASMLPKIIKAVQDASALGEVT